MDCVFGKKSMDAVFADIKNRVSIGNSFNHLGGDLV